MARSAKRQGGAKSRMKLDWVVNEDTYGTLSANNIPNGTISAFPLTYPRSVVNESITQAPLTRYGSAFPEGEKQFVRAVVGWVEWSPGTWAAGSVIRMIMRITKKPMDIATGAAITDAGYSLGADNFANERFAWQRGVNDSFVAGTETRSLMTVNAKVNQWLEPDEALYFMWQNLSGVTQTVASRLYLRTLMRADM